MRRVRVQMLVGAEDTETWEITIKPGDAAWMEGANDAGRTRIDRLATLKANYEKHGIAVCHDLLPGLGTPVRARCSRSSNSSIRCWRKSRNDG